MSQRNSRKITSPVATYLDTMLRSLPKKDSERLESYKETVAALTPNQQAEERCAWKCLDWLIRGHLTVTMQAAGLGEKAEGWPYFRLAEINSTDTLGAARLAVEDAYRIAFAARKTDTELRADGSMKTRHKKRAIASSGAAGIAALYLNGKYRGDTYYMCKGAADATWHAICATPNNPTTDELLFALHESSLELLEEMIAMHEVPENCIQRSMCTISEGHAYYHTAENPHNG